MSQSLSLREIPPVTYPRTYHKSKECFTFLNMRISCWKSAVETQIQYTTVYVTKSKSAFSTWHFISLQWISHMGKTCTDTLLLFLYSLVSSFSLFTSCIAACLCKWGRCLSHVFPESTSLLFADQYQKCIDWLPTVVDTGPPKIIQPTSTGLFSYFCAWLIIGITAGRCR